MIKKLMAGLLVALALSGAVHASEGGVEWDRFPKAKLNDM
ncbi:MAG: hypothetical protein RLZZ598_160, partial [Pseudomonadota bacterium]